MRPRTRGRLFGQSQNVSFSLSRFSERFHWSVLPPDVMLYQADFKVGKFKSFLVGLVTWVREETLVLCGALWWYILECN